MYSPEIIASNISRVQDELGVRLQRLSIPESRQWSRRLALSDPALPEDQRLPLDSGCRAAITNERVLCQLDYSYFAQRYFTILADPSLTGTGHEKRMVLSFRPSQLLFLERLCHEELQMTQACARGEPVAGLRFALHKGRQVLITTICRSLLLHRIWFYPATRSYSISIDPDAIHSLYIRDSDEAYDHLPWWLKPERSGYSKDEYINLANGSFLKYQTYTQRTAIAQGEQYDVAHCTECSRVVPSHYAYKVFEQDLFPACPLSLTTLIMLETTSEEMGDWWQEFSEHVRAGQQPGWQYQFFPWWIDPKKWVAMPPANWSANEKTRRSITRYESLAEDLTGKPVEISPYQQFWWECEYLSHREKGTLNIFLKNWPGEPQESFQHSGVSGFSFDTIEAMRLDSCPPPAAYELLDGDVREKAYPPADDPFPPLIHIGTKYTLQRVHWDSRDPLGLILLWEMPQPLGYYVQGCDPTVGIPNWSRQMRTNLDADINNLGIVIGRCGVKAEDGLVDLQVAEFSSKHDAIDAARYLDALGQLYRGLADDLHCLTIVETTGPGISTQRTFMDVYAACNLFQWEYLDTAAPKPASWFGFPATPKSVEALCMKASRLLAKGGCVVRSPWIVAEAARAYRHHGYGSSTLEVPKGPDGSHGDRLRALMLVLWAAHDWKYEGDSVIPQKVTTQPPVSHDLRADSSLPLNFRFGQQGLPHWQQQMEEATRQMLEAPLTREQFESLRAQGLVEKDDEWMYEIAG